MSQVERENLSALVDGELERDEMRFMLRRTDGNVSLCAAWGRYHIIRDGIRHELPVLADDGFAELVMRQIEAGPMQTATVHRRVRHHWLRWSAGGAIAAGVAAVALIMVQPQMRPTSAPTPATKIAATRSAVTVQPQPMAAPAVPRWLSATPSAAQMAQPAAADFYTMGPPQMVPSADYAQRLSPYMTLPSARVPTARDARQVMYQLWSVAPPRDASRPVSHPAHAH
ncbi:MAG TPA: sigma-E factor negative regulatory protein [Rhodanobacteraceae bacterium]